MKEIKFRALSLDNELIYFDLHESKQSGDSDVFYAHGVPCQSGTEQQFTGLPDKNGKEIFEGDIVKSQRGRLAVIMFVERCAYFGIKFFDEYEVWTFGILEGRHLEVIGNIHDNPELRGEK